MKRHLRGIVDKASWLTVDASTPEPDVIHCLSKVLSPLFPLPAQLALQERLSHLPAQAEPVRRASTDHRPVATPDRDGRGFSSLFESRPDSSGDQVGFRRHVAAMLVLHPSSRPAGRSVRSYSQPDRVCAVACSLRHHRVHRGDDGAFPADKTTALSLQLGLFVERGLIGARVAGERESVVGVSIGVSW